MTSLAEELPDNGDEPGDELPRMTLLEHLDELRRRIFTVVRQLVDR